MNEFECALECDHCQMKALGRSLGDSCRGCGKAIMGRRLRPATLDVAQKNYTGQADESEDPMKDPDFVSELEDSIQSWIRSVCASDASARISTIDASGAHRLAGSRPKVSDLTTEDKNAILSGIVVSEDLNSVESELIALMKSDGYGKGRGDASLRKYRSYLSMLFDKGGFTCRSAFFEEGAQDRAYKIYDELALAKVAESNGTTTAHRYSMNFKRGFDVYVTLAKKHRPNSAVPQAPPPPDLTDILTGVGPDVVGEASLDAIEDDLNACLPGGAGQNPMLEKLSDMIDNNFDGSYTTPVKKRSTRAAKCKDLYEMPQMDWDLLASSVCFSD